MPLMSHQPARMVVPLIGDNSVSLRGFNLDDFLALIPEHIEELSKIATLYSQQKEAVFSNKAMMSFLMAIGKDFPGIIMEVISISADEPEAKDIKLSTALQIACLGAIVKMTVEEAGGLGNLFAQLRSLGANVMAAQAELRNA
jgi:hypothetical protein